MKIDKWFFDHKDRYYNLYICVKRWVFMFCMSIRDWFFEIRLGKYQKLRYGIPDESM